MSFALPRIFSLGHDRGITPDTPPIPQKHKTRYHNRHNIPPRIDEENTFTSRAQKMVDALGNDPWSKTSHLRSIHHLAPLSPEEEEEEDQPLLLPDYDVSWERRQLNALRRFAGTADTTSSSLHSQPSASDQHHRMPIGKQRRMPTPVFRPLTRSLFGKYPPEGKFAVLHFQTLYRKHRCRHIIATLRQERDHRLYLNRTANYLQQWAKRCLTVRGYFSSSDYWDAVRRAILAKLVPELALDVVVEVMGAAKRQINMIAQSVAAISTIVQFYREWKQIQHERAALRQRILEHHSSIRIVAAWKRSRLRIKLKAAVKGLALRFRSVLVLQRVARGRIARKRVQWIRQNQTIVCIQRRWFFYRSRRRFTAQKQAIYSSAQLMDLKNAEQRIKHLLEQEQHVEPAKTAQPIPGGSTVLLEADDCFFLLAWHGTTCSTPNRNAQEYRKRLLRLFQPVGTNRYKAYDARALAMEHRGAGDDLYANVPKHGRPSSTVFFQSLKKNITKRKKSTATESNGGSDGGSGGTDDLDSPRKHNDDDVSDCSGDLEHLGNGESHGLEDFDDSDDELDNVEPIDADLDCRIISDVQLQALLNKLLHQVKRKDDVTMVRMAQALHLFSMGQIEDLVRGRDIMTTVRKTDKNCLLFKQHDQRITFINKWMAISPCVLNLSLEFDPVHLHHLQALRDWHCYRRYDLAALHFEKAMQIAKPSERPFTYSAYKCTHGKTWKLNVRRMMQSYRRFLGFHTARTVIETIGMVTTSLLLEQRARVSKTLMKIRVYQEGNNLLFDAAGIKRVRQPKNDGKSSPLKKKKKKKKKNKPQEVLTGDRWTTIVTGEELRKLFVELGRKGDLLKPIVAAKGVIDMLVLCDVPSEFTKMDGSQEERVLGIRVASGLEAKYKTIYYQTTQGFNLTLTFFMSDDKAMTIQAHRTLTNGEQLSYGLFLPLEEIVLLFHDYDKQLKDYIFHACWRARSIHLIKQMVQHMELEKSMVGGGGGGGANRTLAKQPIRLLTVVNGKEKDEFDVHTNYLAEATTKDHNPPTTTKSPKSPKSSKSPKRKTSTRSATPEEATDNKKVPVVRLVVAKKNKRTLDAAKGFIAFRGQSWWQGLKGRRRVHHIRTVLAANVVVRYVRPWYMERQGRINHIQRVVRGHLRRINMMVVFLTPLEEAPSVWVRTGLTYVVYRAALLRFFAARKGLRVMNSKQYAWRKEGQEGGRRVGRGGIRIGWDRR